MERERFLFEMAMQEFPELTSSHEHTKIINTYSAKIYENDLKKIFHK